MVTIAEKRRWKSKPLDCWTKFKEVTNTRFLGPQTAKKEKEKLTGLGENWPISHMYASQVAGRGLATEFVEAAEAKGYPRELCGYARIDLGSIFLDKYAFGGSCPKPEYCTLGADCDAALMQIQPIAEHFKVPICGTDRAQTYEFDSEQSKRNKIEFVVGQTLDNMEWLEKTTGKEFDDEAHIETLYRNSRRVNLAGQILLLNQNIPAPLDEKTMYSVLAAGARSSEDDPDEGIELLQILRDEVEDRVRNQIAAVATERYRMMSYGIPPYYALYIFRYLEKYGAVSIGCRYLFNNAGGLSVVNGIEIPVPTLQERGVVLRTREDAVRAAAERLIEQPGWHHRFGGNLERENQLRMARLWHCDGMMMHYNRSCWGVSLWGPQIRLAFQENNIPVVTYEGSHGDPRDWDRVRVLARLDAFFESQGLEKLDD